MKSPSKLTCPVIDSLRALRKTRSCSWAKWLGYLAKWSTMERGKMKSPTARALSSYAVLASLSPPRPIKEIGKMASSWETESAFKSGPMENYILVKWRKTNLTEKEIYSGLTVSATMENGIGVNRVARELFSSLNLSGAHSKSTKTPPDTSY